VADYELDDYDSAQMIGFQAKLTVTQLVKKISALYGT
jgi:hypothetical protein